SPATRRLRRVSHPQTGRRTALLLGAVVPLAACGSPGTSSAPGATDALSSAPLSGEIAIDGSSTVFPISAAVAEEFQIEHPNVKVTVAFSGTGGGLKKFCSNEIAANAGARLI